MAPRRWLPGVLMGAMMLAACSEASSAELPTAPPQGSFTILHTNDFHGRHQPFAVAPGNATAQTGDPGREPEEFERGGRVGGLAQLATAVERLRERHGAERVILLHGGDTFSDDLLGNLTRGEAVIRAMNAMQYQFMAFGNHDFDYGSERTRELQQVAAFPMRGANVLEKATGRPFLGEPFVVLRAGGYRVGVLALGYHNTDLTGSPENTQALQFTSGIEAAARWVPELRRQSDVVVVLSHEGTRVDEEIARRVPGIDVIIGAHSHDDIPAKQVGSTWITQALSDAARLGELTVRVEEGKVVEVSGRTHTLWTDDYPADTEVAALLEQQRAPHRARLEEPIATAAERIGRQYKSESPFDKLAGELLREHTGAEVAFLPGVGYGVSLNPGPVTREMLYTLLPHPSKVVTLTLTGAQILELLEQSATNQDPGDPMQRVGGLIQPSGVKWTADLTRPIGQRVRDVSIGGQPLAPARSYRVVTHSGMLQGIHRYTTFSRGSDIQRREEQVTDVVEAGMKRRGTLRAPAPGDLTLVKG